MSTFLDILTADIFVNVARKSAEPPASCSSSDVNILVSDKASAGAEWGWIFAVKP